MVGRGLSETSNTSLVKSGKTILKGTVFAGAVIDIGEAATGNEGLGKTALDLTVSGVAAIEGGPITITGALIYQGVDAFYPGGISGLATDVGKATSETMKPITDLGRMSDAQLYDTLYEGFVGPSMGF